MSTSSDTAVAHEVRRPEDTTIRYTLSGAATGPTWVFIHGWGCRRSDFVPLTAFLPADHRVIAVDLAGHGDSRSMREDWSVAEFARDVAAVTDAESVETCTVVGHSLGAAVGVELARLKPQMVTNIVGIDAFHYLTLYPAAQEPAIRELLAVFESDFPGGVKLLVTMGSVPTTNPLFGETIFQKMSSVPAQVGIGALDGLLRWDMDGALRDVSQPITTLAVRGLLDPAAVDRYGDRINFVVVDLGSHHFLLEEPEATAELLLGSHRRMVAQQGLDAATTARPVDTPVAD